MMNDIAHSVIQRKQFKMMRENNIGVILESTSILIIIVSSLANDCISYPKNFAVYEEDTYIEMNLITIPTSVKWTLSPTSNEFDSVTISSYSDNVDPSLNGLFYLNESGLVILKGRTTDNGGLPSTSGLYIAQYANISNQTGAKLVVVRSAPDCSCNATSLNGSQLSCSIIYADFTLHPINANMTWMIGDVFYTSDTPTRTRINYYVFQSTSTITVESSISENVTCIVTFNEPTDIVYPFIATNAPEFSASCSVEVCGLIDTTSMTTITPIKTMQPATTMPSVSTTQSPFSTTQKTSTKLPLTTATRQPTTLLKTTTSSTVTPSYCSSNMKNIAVREGTLNVPMNVTSSPCTVTWIVFPTTDEAFPKAITGPDCRVDPSLADLYYLNRTGLIIRNSTTGDGEHQSTAGLYKADCSNDNSTAGAWIIVVRSGPDCSCLPDSSDVQLSCTVTFADETINPIPAIITWIINGEVYTTESPQKNKTDLFVFTATSTITVDGSTINSYQCILTFGEPANGSQYEWIATNAPEFNESCSTPVCYNATTMNSQSTTTVATQSTRADTSPTTSSNHMNGSLARRPTNTAAVAGSRNVPLECASNYGTDTLRWSFIPFSSSNNEIILISSGYELLANNDQLYILHATVDSSILIVRQLSSATEGTYVCSDGDESTSALFMTISFVISMEPLFGPIAGGTNLVITGSETIDYFSRYVDSNLTGIRNVFIGNELSSTSVSLLSNASSAFELLAVTPNATEESIEQSLPIIIEFSPTPFNMTFNTAFTYLPNPDITDISPNSFIVTGGTLVNVTGRSLSSVAKPIIQLKVVITRAAENRPTSTISREVCTVPPGNDTFMQCPLPPLNIPDDFLEILNSLYNTSASRSRRSIQSMDQLISNSHSLLLSRKKRDTNALTVRNGKDQLDIYLGFILDGYKAYENINDALPDTRIILYSTPEINSSNEVLDFDPSDDEFIYIKGKYMLRGCRLRDYVVHTGNQICTNYDLQDNQLTCRPPKVEPSSTVNDSIYCNEHLSITITLGYKQYQYACIKYVDHSSTFALIVGLIVGFSGFALFITLLITCIIRRKVNQKTDRHQQHRIIDNRNPKGENYARPESELIIYKREQTFSLYKPNDGYATSIDDVDDRSQYIAPSSDASDAISNPSSNAVYQNDTEF